MRMHLRHDPSCLRGSMSSLVVSTTISPMRMVVTTDLPMSQKTYISMIMLASTLVPASLRDNDTALG